VNYKPVTAVWEITFACNMRCKHCGSSCDSFLPDELTTEEALALCDDIGKLGLRYLTLSGGEPFLRKDWHLIARRLRDNDVIPVIITNGWFIDEDIIEKAFWAEVSNIAISMDGLRKNHDFMRREGSFDRILRALRLLKEKNMSSSIVTCINKSNIKELPQLKDLLIENGVDSWQLQIAVAMGNLLDHPHLMIDPEQVDTIINFAFDTNKEGNILVYLADCVGYYHDKEVEVRKMVSSDKSYDGLWRGCPAGKYSFGIRCNGNIIGCTSIRDDSYLEGNVRDISLPEIWEAKDSFAWNRNLRKEDLSGFCRLCQYGTYCLGGCSNSKLTMAKSLYENHYCSFRVAVEREKEKVNQITDREQLIEAGKKHVGNRDYQFAEIYFARVLEMTPDSHEAADYLGFIHFQMENYDKCLEFNHLSLKINPLNAYAMKGLGNCLVRMGRRDEGIASLKKSIHMASGDFFDPYHDLAVVYYENRQYNDALKILEEAREKSDVFINQSQEFYQLLKEKLG
jgi:radical SAM protein with 4Fe4S-binding SPASM domain